MSGTRLSPWPAIRFPARTPEVRPGRSTGMRGPFPVPKPPMKAGTPIIRTIRMLTRPSRRCLMAPVSDARLLTRMLVPPAAGAAMPDKGRLMGLKVISSTWLYGWEGWFTGGQRRSAPASAHRPAHQKYTRPVLGPLLMAGCPERFSPSRVEGEEDLSDCSQRKTVKGRRRCKTGQGQTGRRFYLSLADPQHLSRM